jgi:hypothetical protein
MKNSTFFFTLALRFPNKKVNIIIYYLKRITMGNNATSIETQVANTLHWAKQVADGKQTRSQGLSESISKERVIKKYQHLNFGGANDVSFEVEITIKDPTGKRSTANIDLLKPSSTFLCPICASNNMTTNISIANINNHMQRHQYEMKANPTTDQVLKDLEKIADDNAKKLKQIDRAFPFKSPSPELKPLFDDIFTSDGAPKYKQSEINTRDKYTPAEDKYKHMNDIRGVNVKQSYTGDNQIKYEDYVDLLNDNQGNIAEHHALQIAIEESKAEAERAAQKLKSPSQELKPTICSIPNITILRVDSTKETKEKNSLDFYNAD